MGLIPDQRTRIPYAAKPKQINNKMCKMKQCDENQYSKEKDQNTVLLKEKSLTTG